MSQVKISGNASGTGVLTIAAPNTNTDRTINIPDTAGDIVTTGDSGTITAPMLDGGQTGSAPALAVRAYINFNGTGTVAIRESVNISSLTDNTTGSYTVNYTTAMPNADYAASFGCRQTSTGTDAFGRLSATMSTSQTQMIIKDMTGTSVDAFTVTLMVCV